jgi:hypothetical protein
LLQLQAMGVKIPAKTNEPKETDQTTAAVKKPKYERIRKNKQIQNDGGNFNQ